MRTPAQILAANKYNQRNNAFKRLADVKKEAARLKKNREQQELRKMRKELTY